MEPFTVFKVPATVTRIQNDEVEGIKHQINEVSSQVDKLEQTVQEIEQFFSNSGKRQHINSKSVLGLRERDKDKERHITSSKKQQDKVAASDRMQELMCQFGMILNQITHRRGARSSVESVDVKNLGLQDSSEVAGKPMDFGTIKKQMEAKGDSGYKNVREIYADVRLVLKKAMKYNDDKSDAHVTAKTLLAKFEEKWLQLLPKVMQEETRRQEEEAVEQSSHVQMAKDISNELYEVEVRLEELREFVVRRCRRMSTVEKRELGKALVQLSADELRRALDIVAQGNPTFQASTEEVDLDIDAQSDSTLWRLKCFVLEILRARSNPSAAVDGNNKNNANAPKPSNSKRKRETSDPDALGKSSKKMTQKLGSMV